MYSFLQLNIHLINFSDALRLVLIYRYGGWYADIDFVFLKPLKWNGKQLSNMLTSDGMTRNQLQNANMTCIGRHIANA